MGSTAADGSLAGLERIAAQGPSPEFAAMMAEECRRLLDSLDDDSLRQVALSRMEGYNNDEIADTARLCAANRRAAARPDPQNLARHRGGGLMFGDRHRRVPSEPAWNRPAGSTRCAKSLNAAGAAATGSESKTCSNRPSPSDRPALLEELLILEIELRRADGASTGSGRVSGSISRGTRARSRRRSPQAAGAPRSPSETETVVNGSASASIQADSRRRPDRSVSSAITKSSKKSPAAAWGSSTRPASAGPTGWSRSR